MPQSSFTGILARTTLVILATLAAAVGGAILASMLSSAREVVGFDALADFLGGLLAGAGLGLIGGLLLAVRLAASRLMAAISAVVGLVVLELLLLLGNRLFQFW